MGDVVEYIAKDEISESEEFRLLQLANHISELEHDANLSALKLRLQQASDLIEAFKTLTGRTPFEATEDSARLRFRGWIDAECRAGRAPFDNRKAWELIHLHRFCEKRPAALNAENISVKALIELSRPKLITKIETVDGKQVKTVVPEREKVVSDTFKKLRKRKTVTAKDAKDAIYADLEAANFSVYKAPPAPWTVQKAEIEIEKLINRIRLGFKRKPEDREYLKRKLISEAEGQL